MRDLWFDGHRIRAGRLLVFSAYVTHRLPELWPEPTEFRPSRWDPGAPDYRKPAPHEFIPISGGLRRGIGAGHGHHRDDRDACAAGRQDQAAVARQRIRPHDLAALSPRPGLTVAITDLVGDRKRGVAGRWGYPRGAGGRVATIALVPAQ